MFKDQEKNYDGKGQFLTLFSMQSFTLSKSPFLIDHTRLLILAEFWNSYVELLKLKIRRLIVNLLEEVLREIGRRNFTFVYREIPTMIHFSCRSISTSKNMCNYGFHLTDFGT